MVLEAGVAELVDRAGLAEHAPLVGVLKERDEGPGQSAGQRQPEAGEDRPLAPGGQAERVAEGAAEPADDAQFERRPQVPDEWAHDRRQGPDHRPGSQADQESEGGGPEEELDGDRAAVRAQQADRIDGGPDVERGFEEGQKAEGGARSQREHKAVDDAVVEADGQDGREADVGEEAVEHSAGEAVAEAEDEPAQQSDSQSGEGSLAGCPDALAGYAQVPAGYPHAHAGRLHGCVPGHDQEPVRDPEHESREEPCHQTVGDLEGEGVEEGAYGAVDEPDGQTGHQRGHQRAGGAAKPATEPPPLQVGGVEPGQVVGEVAEPVLGAFRVVGATRPVARAVLGPRAVDGGGEVGEEVVLQLLGAAESPGVQERGRVAVGGVAVDGAGQCDHQRRGQHRSEVGTGRTVRPVA